MGLKFKLLDRVILTNGQKGMIFTMPEQSFDPTPIERGIPIYGVLYNDSKGFNYGPYDVDENSMQFDTTQN